MLVNQRGRSLDFFAILSCVESGQQQQFKSKQKKIMRNSQIFVLCCFFPFSFLTSSLPVHQPPQQFMLSILHCCIRRAKMCCCFPHSLDPTNSKRIQSCRRERLFSISLGKGLLTGSQQARRWWDMTYIFLRTYDVYGFADIRMICNNSIPILHTWFPSN